MDDFFVYFYRLQIRARIVPSGAWVEKVIKVDLFSSTEPSFSVLFSANPEVSCLVRASTSFSRGDYDYVVHAEQRNVEIVLDEVTLVGKEPVVCLSAAGYQRVIRKLDLLRRVLR